MNPEQFKRLDAIFREAARLQPTERDAFLRKACGGDAELRAAVERLLAADEQQPTMEVEADEGTLDDVMETSAVEQVPSRPSRPSHPSSRPRTDHDAPPPSQVGPYRIMHELGHGGMGVVYVASRENDPSSRPVALKVLRRGMDTEDVLHRFELERHVLGTLNHPGIARLYDAGETADGLPYFVMEYIEGLHLDEYCDTHRLKIDERLKLFRKVCAAVHYAHQNLIVHRDLKPGNIIVTEDGEPKLLDFGIAKLINPGLAPIAEAPTRPELRVMTPEYASPEQVRGNPISTATDVYSLGVLLYELVSGHRPYHFKSRVREEIERVVCDDDPERPSSRITRVEEIPTTGHPGSGKMITPATVSRTRESRPDRLRKRLTGDIDNIVLMAMRKEPQRRYTSAEQFADDIQLHLDGMPVKARPDTVGYRFSKFVVRHRVGVAMATAMVTLLVLGIVATTWQWRIAETARANAEQAQQAEAEQRVIAETEREAAQSARQSESEQRSIAETERDRATRRFEQVRALARTFMFDFHEMIKRLDGALPARELLVTTALTYLDALAEEVGDNVELRRELAHAYARVGDLQGSPRNPNLGLTVAAMESYRKSLSICEALRSELPDDASIQDQLTTVQLKIDDLRELSGAGEAALDSQMEVLRLREQVARKSPSDIDAQRDLYIALQSAGDSLLRTGDTRGAITFYERSLELRRATALVVADRYARGLSTAMLRVAFTQTSHEDPDAAIALFDEVVEIRARLAESNPTNRRRRDLLTAQIFLAQSFIDLDRFEDARTLMVKSLSIARALVRANPTDVRSAADLGLTLDMLGRAQSGLGDWAAAEDSLREALAQYVPLVDADPAHSRRRSHLATMHESHARVRAALGDVPGGIEEVRQGIDILRALVVEDDSNAHFEQSLAHALMTLGQLLSDDDRSGPALIAFNESRSLFSSLLEASPDDRLLRVAAATSLHRLSRLMFQLDDVQSAVEHATEARRLLERETTASSVELRETIEADLARFGG